MVQAELPISAHAEVLVRAIGENPVVVVIGETGSGKTTQLSQVIGALTQTALTPRVWIGQCDTLCLQLLYKAGFAAKGGIAVTQPRRVVRPLPAKGVLQHLHVFSMFQLSCSAHWQSASSGSTRDRCRLPSQWHGGLRKS